MLDGVRLVVSPSHCSFPISSNCITFRGCFPTSFLHIFGSSSHSGTSTEDSPTEPKDPGFRIGVHGGRPCRREPHLITPQKDPIEQMLKDKLLCPPPLAHTHSSEGQPRSKRRSLGFTERTARRVRLDSVREEGAVSNGTECSHRIGLST